MSEPPKSSPTSDRSAKAPDAGTMDLSRQLSRWRRDFHAHPELGFREYRTSSIVCDFLATLPGCRVRRGIEVMNAEARLGAPSAPECETARQEALAAGANPQWLPAMGDGLTGVVAEWDFAKPGPTVAFRFDLDALPVTESTSSNHIPVREKFVSTRRGRMHACGHDAHTAIGLGLASVIAQHAAQWGGRLKLIFQPAEEGCCGAAAMVRAGVVDDVDYFIAAHLGTAANEAGLVSCGVTGFLATTKFDVTLHGVAAHAGMNPNAGRNALLAAAALTLQLHAIPRHAGGDSRVNVGVLNAGAGRNIIADRAELKLEVRGATTEVNDYMTAEARRIIEATAQAYNVTAEIRVVGAAPSANCDAGLKAIVRRAAGSLPATRKVVDSLDVPGSEDAAFFMNAVQARGGQATYLLVGSKLPAGHHHPEFDIDETAMLHAVELHTAIASQLLSPT